ncbi:Cyclic di-GMP phosphodiesterase response regulator RpfG [Marinomonas aquimarina]|uniref:Cyclic di-GMP phosphodiesterase response regulator RpfG n=1 Tax=Marinomonas aquimarina TaxID=295068 RepID=A0A1A8T7W1_9GAMM|nr:two-component system response regulator [Marinomonas aquimarina]SBS28693.1 Cyclic di-GMP phosphodiesterase response regulator RpfG [Marinomonas aquimarina]
MSDKKTVLIVDDTPANVSLLYSVLKDSYKTKIATNGDKALQLAFADNAPDLILLDIMMPGMDGYEVCERLKADPRTKDIPVVFLTAKVAVEDETRGLAMGAVDYITKPISPPIVLERVKNHLILKEARDLLQRQNEVLEEKVLDRTKKLDELQDVVMEAMGALAESRDPETGNHIRRTQLYVKLLAEKLREKDAFKDYLTPERITLLYKAAPLHDIGKVGVPDAILLKPGKLTPEEFERMKLHTVYGREAIEAAEKKLSEPNELLTLAKEIAYSHQEKWDGSGYPDALSREDIPISARLMAIADVYDALISRRVYKPPFTHEKAISIMVEGKGSHFDPVMLEAFLEISNEFYRVAERYQDSEDDVQSAHQ